MRICSSVRVGEYLLSSRVLFLQRTHARCVASQNIFYSRKRKTITNVGAAQCPQHTPTSTAPNKAENARLQGKDRYITFRDGYLNSATIFLLAQLQILYMIISIS